jgi:hypothetical protein
MNTIEFNKHDVDIFINGTWQKYEGNIGWLFKITRLRDIKSEFSYIICSYLRRLVIQNSLKCTETLQRFFSIRFQIRSVFFINCDLFIELLLTDIAQTYIDTDSHKLKQVKIVIIICQTSNQSATTEQNYCSSKSIYCAMGNVDRSYF